MANIVVCLQGIGSFSFDPNFQPPLEFLDDLLSWSSMHELDLTWIHSRSMGNPGADHSVVSSSAMDSLFYFRWSFEPYIHQHR